MKINLYLFLFLFFILHSLQSFAADAKNSFVKIDEALQKKEISDADALGYKVLAFFHDGALPTKFIADPDSESESDSDKYLASAQGNLAQMSRPLAIAVYSYLIPEPFRAAKNNKADDDQDFPKPSAIPSLDWTFIENSQINVKIWYKKDSDTQFILADKMMDELNNVIIPKIKTLTGKTHISDAFVNSGIAVAVGLTRGQPNGGDGKLDIYLYDVAPVNPGERPPKAWVQHYNDIEEGNLKCKSNASYMAFNWDWAKSQKDERIFSTLAHEYFHVIQNTYDKKMVCEEYDKVDEGTATWVKHYVYPKLNDEHNMFEFSEDGHMSLIDTAHESWPYYFYLAQTFGEQTIPKIYEMVANLGPMDAVDAAAPGGFKKTWPEYSIYEWNQDPLQDTFRYWDDYKIVPGRGAKVFGHRPKIEKEKIELNLKGQYRKLLELELPPLTRDFYAFDVSDENIHSISIDNPTLFRTNLITVKALLRKKGQSTMEEVEWNDNRKEVYTFCLDKKDEQIEEIVLVIANHQHKPSAQTYHGESAVKMTNQGCHKFSGKMTSNWIINEPGHSQKLEITGTNIILEQSGFNSEGGFKGHFHVASGVVSYSYSGQVDSCSGFAAGMASIKTGVGNISLGLYPYNVAPDAWGQYYIAVPLVESFINVTYVCPPPRKSFVAPVPLALSAGSVMPNHRGFSVLKGKTNQVQTGWTSEWEFTPVRE